MVDAFTFDDGGQPRKFNNRAAMYDYMIEHGHMVIEGDDAPKFLAHAEKKAQAGNAKADTIVKKIKE